MDKNYFLTVFFTIGLFLSAANINALSQDTAEKELSLDEAVSHALEYNLNLKKMRVDLDASGYADSKSWSEVFPTINATARAGIDTPLFTGSGFEINDKTVGYSAGVGISLGLNAGVPYAMKNTHLVHQENLLRYEEACTQLSVQITKKYYSLAAEKNNLIFLEEVLNLAQKQYERSQISFRNGLVRELSVIQSRLAYENARYSLSAANIAYSNSMAEFLAMLGMPQGERITLLDKINIVKITADSETLIRDYLSARPDIARNMQEIERLENVSKQLSLQNKSPSLDLSMNWSSSKFNPFNEKFSASANLRIPIDSWIPGTTKSQTVDRSKDSIEKAKLDLESAETTAKTLIRTLTALLQNSWDSILIARLGYEAAELNYGLTEQGFNNGIIESLVLDDARNNMTSARQRLYQSELAYFNMILDLSAAINMDWKNLVKVFGVQGE
ncbi:MAG: TolC family protein [Spirochaetes bacterium]|nr:TolC family protein [Spirochaetota bacterium]